MRAAFAIVLAFAVGCANTLTATATLERVEHVRVPAAAELCAGECHEDAGCFAHCEGATTLPGPCDPAERPIAVCGTRRTTWDETREMDCATVVATRPPGVVVLHCHQAGHDSSKGTLAATIAGLSVIVTLVALAVLALSPSR